MWQNATRRATAETGPEAEYQRVKAEAHRVLAEAVDPSRLERWPADRVEREVRELADRLARDMDAELRAGDRDRLARELLDEVFGLGPLERFAHDPEVTEILANGPDKVFVERAGRLQLTDVKFADEAHLMRLVQRMASKVGRRIDESSPMVDARLPDGSRVNAVIRPLSAEGPVLSIRRFPRDLTAADLVSLGSITPEIMQFLQAAIAGKLNVLISGGTGAGKTTLLNALSAAIPPDERVVTIEDTLELRLQQPHVVRMETRPANLEGRGEVSQRQLLRNALRMRPDRIIVGECRGPEAVDMLQAMNTGHEGSLTTVHANGPRDALGRLEVMVGTSGASIPTDVLRGYIARAIQVIVHVARLKGGERRVTRVSELRGLNKKTHRYVVKDIFAFDQTGVEGGAAVGSFRTTGYQPRFADRVRVAGIDVSPALFVGKDHGDGADLVELRKE